MIAINVFGIEYRSKYRRAANLFLANHSSAALENFIEVFSVGNLAHVLFCK